MSFAENLANVFRDAACKIALEREVAVRDAVIYELMHRLNAAENNFDSSPMFALNLQKLSDLADRSQTGGTLTQLHQSSDPNIVLLVTVD